MKVLHLAPLWFPVAQDSPGGIETLLPGLLRALEELGCRNTLIASEESRTTAELLPAVSRNICAQMEAGTVWEYAGYEQHQLLMALERAPEFDVIHSHLGWGAYVLSRVPGMRERLLHTQHNAVTHDLEWFVRRHPDLLFSTVSEFQAQKLRRQGATRCHVIPNGIDVASFTFRPRGGEGLLFLGRLEEEKGPALAVRVARALGRPLTLAGPAVEQEWFDREIAPLLGDGVRYVGRVDHRQKDELLGQAGCLLMPSVWEEPFGLVSVEAMACGTPVVALANGALPEIVEPGLTGYLAGGEEELAGLVAPALALDRARVRARVAERFDLSVVAAGYRKLYREMLATSGRPCDVGR